MKTILKNKNGNLVYLGYYSGVRYKDGKFYAGFDRHSIREVPQDKGTSQRCDMTRTEFQTLKEVSRVKS